MVPVTDIDGHYESSEDLERLGSLLNFRQHRNRHKHIAAAAAVRSGVVASICDDDGNNSIDGCS